MRIVIHSKIGKINNHNIRFNTVDDSPNFAMDRVNLYLYKAIDGKMNVRIVNVNKETAQKIWVSGVSSG
jgi:hypothetical protein